MESSGERGAVEAVATRSRSSASANSSILSRMACSSNSFAESVPDPETPFPEIVFAVEGEITGTDCTALEGACISFADAEIVALEAAGSCFAESATVFAGAGAETNSVGVEEVVFRTCAGGVAVDGGASILSLARQMGQ